MDYSTTKLEGGNNKKTLSYLHLSILFDADAEPPVVYVDLELAKLSKPACSRR